MEIGNEISQKIRSAIKAKLVDLGAYVDDELPDYIMVMVANKKSQQQMTDDLNLFLGSNTEKFTAWLHSLLTKLKSIASEPSGASREAKTDEKENVVDSASSAKSTSKDDQEKMEVVAATEESDEPVLTIRPEIDEFEEEERLAAANKAKVAEQRIAAVKAAEHHTVVTKVGQQNLTVAPVSPAVMTVVTPAVAPPQVLPAMSVITSMSNQEPPRIKPNLASPPSTRHPESIIIQKTSPLSPQATIQQPPPVTKITLREAEFEPYAPPRVVPSAAMDAHNRKRKLPGSVVVKVEHEPYQEEEYDPLHPMIGRVASTVRVGQRKPSVPVSRQASASLVMKAVTEAHDSVEKSAQRQTDRQADRQADRVMVRPIMQRVGSSSRVSTPHGPSSRMRSAGMTSSSTSSRGHHQPLRRPLSSSRMVEKDTSERSIELVSKSKRQEEEYRRQLAAEDQEVVTLTEEYVPKMVTPTSSSAVAAQRYEVTTQPQYEIIRPQYEILQPRYEIVQPRYKVITSDHPQYKVVAQPSPYEVSESRYEITQPRYEVTKPRYKIIEQRVEAAPEEHYIHPSQARAGTEVERAVVEEIQEKRTVAVERSASSTSASRASESTTSQHELEMLIESGADESDFTDEEQETRTVKESTPVRLDPPASPKFVVTLDGVDQEQFLTRELSEMDVSETESPKLRNIVRVKPTLSSYDTHQPDDMMMEDSEDWSEGSPPKRGRMPERCKFWPLCKTGADCPYHHPSITCKTFPKCKFGDKCLFIHPNCKFDASCTRSKCPFTHASKRQNPSNPAQVVIQPVKMFVLCETYTTILKPFIDLRRLHGVIALGEKAPMARDTLSMTASCIHSVAVDISPTLPLSPVVPMASPTSPTFMQGPFGGPPPFNPASSSSSSKSTVPCRFYPNCTNMNCPFQHPKSCRFGANCRKKSSCPFLHPNVPSRDQLKWTADKAAANAAMKTI